MALEYTARIRVGVATDSAALKTAAQDFADYIKAETLTIDLRPEPLPGVTPLEMKVGDEACRLYLAPVEDR
jgi:hypothetical protein